MRPTVLLTCVFFASLCFGAINDVPQTPTQALKQFQIEPGLRLSLAASEPATASPVAVTWDERGKMFVAENRSYPHFGKTPPPKDGVIALLEDRDGDGQYETRTVFADGFTFPNGLTCWRGGIFVTCAPDIFYLKDTDGDGRADVRRIVLTGFGTNSTEQLRVSHPTLGLDGWIYLTSGLVGGEVTSPMKPGLAPVKFARNDSRFHPDSLDFEPLPGVGQFGLAFDAAGRRFNCANRSPATHIVLAPRYLARNPHLNFSETVQDAAVTGAASRVYPLSADSTTAGFIPSLINDLHAGTFTSACGLSIFTGHALTPAHVGNAFICEPAQNLVQRQILTAAGGTFTARIATAGREFLATTDTWFRPVFTATGPDGALYICDMYRRNIDHPQYLPEAARPLLDFNSGKDKGRIWRVVRTSHPELKPRDLSKFTQEELVKLLGSNNGHERDAAHRLLHEMLQPAGMAALNAAVTQGANEHARLRALHLLAARGLLGLDLLATALTDKHPLVRETALALAEPHLAKESGLAGKVAALSGDADPRVRFQCALALGAGNAKEQLRPLAEIGLRGAEDRWTRAAVLSAIGTHSSLFFDAAISMTSRSSHAPLFRDLGKIIGTSQPTNEVLRVMERMNTRAAMDQQVAFAFISGLAEGLRQNDSVKGARLNDWLPATTPARTGLSRQFDAAAKLAGRTDGDVSARIESIGFLSHADMNFAGPVLLALVVAAEPNEIQIAAIRAMSQFRNGPMLGTLLMRERWRSYPPAVRETVLAVSIEQPAARPALINALESGLLPSSVITPARRTQLQNDNRPEVGLRAKKIFAELAGGDRMKTFESHKDALLLKADAAKGAAVFERACASCHTHSGRGFSFGPDLTGMRNQPAETLLLHIIVPNHEVLPNYTHYEVELKDTRNLSGIIVAETPVAITLKMALGQQETIRRASIAQLNASALSPMPDQLEATMTRQELADLISFLKK